jgi:hypothetical protein
MQLALDTASPCPAVGFSAGASLIQLPGSTPHLLLALTRHAHTTIMAWDGEQATPLTQPQLMGKTRWSPDRQVLAYEALEGINPLDNVVVVADLATGRTWQISSEGGCAILGFTLDGTGELGLLQVAMRGQFKPAPWQLTLLDLMTGNWRVIGPAEPQEVAFEPVGWSQATDEIILHAFVPFQADGAAGLWAVRPDGSGLRPLLAETEYVGAPRLSPDGRLLAFFASEPELLPSGYIARPGEPPANALRLLDLVTGQTHTLATAGDGAFGALAWDPSRGRIYFSRGAWEGPGLAFRFEKLLSVDVEASEPPAVMARLAESIAGLQACNDGRLAYVTTGEQGNVVHWDKAESSGGLHWAVGDAGVELLGCMPGEPAEMRR